MPVLNHCKKVWTDFLSYRAFDAHALSGLKLVSASKGRILCELPLEQKHMNGHGSCHGGLLSAVVDVGGSLAIAAEDMDATGVSTDLNISFVSSAKIGETLVIDSRCDKIGGTLAYTSVEIKVEDKIIALGRHTKYVRLAHISNAARKKGEKTKVSGGEKF
ncbi:hypothetical protein BGZ83_001905 [Gryganskiella cystojenkinii]|nr:hypothetical protein BGZ83_001905 [Gryganskiella cystojenkinii]